MKPSDKLTEHFRLGEFLRDGSMEGVTPEVILNLRELAKVLEAIRELFGGRAIIITSGFRTASRNAQIKGAVQGSQHLLGRAADFVVKGLDHKYVQAILMKNKDKLGVCVEITNGAWTHVDLRQSCIVFENKGGGRYPVLSLAEINAFIKKHGVA